MKFADRVSNLKSNTIIKHSLLLKLWLFLTSYNTDMNIPVIQKYDGDIYYKDHSTTVATTAWLGVDLLSAHSTY